MTDDTPEKPSLQAFIDHHHLALADIASAGRVSFTAIENACQGKPVAVAEATGLINALRFLTGRDYGDDFPQIKIRSARRSSSSREKGSL